MQVEFHQLSDARWQIIEQILNDHRKRKHNLRDVMDCILEILRTGTQWRNLKNPKLRWQIVYYYFRKWRFDGTLERLNSELNKIERKRQGKQQTPSLLCIDSQPIKLAPFMDIERGADGNKKVNGRKRHMIVDTLGLCWGVVVHAANMADGQKAHLLVEHCLGYLDRMQKVLVDQAYRKTFKDWVESSVAGLQVEIAARPPRLCAGQMAVDQ